MKLLSASALAPNSLSPSPSFNPSLVTRHLKENTHEKYRSNLIRHCVLDKKNLNPTTHIFK